MKNIYKMIGLILLSVSFLAIFACQKKDETANTNTVSSGNTSSTPQTAFATQRAKSPTEAYKMLYDYVKAKNTEGIKSMMTKESVGLVEFQAESRKIPVEEVYKNGLTATTFADNLPAIRDERIKDNMGAVEVKNVKDNVWEDVAFMLEDGGWKLASGNIFKGDYKSPGRGQSFKEKEVANKATNNMIEVKPNNANVSKIQQVPQPPNTKSKE